MIRILTTIVIISMFACGDKDSKNIKTSNLVKKEVNQIHSTHSKHYNFSNPVHSFSLPAELLEISGLDYDNGRLVAMNDEKGVIYELDHKSGAIIKDYVFSNDGDYEGIEKVDRDIVVLQSNGNLNIYNPVTKENKIIDTPFKTKNNMEGLTYNSQSKKLLLATKGEGFVGYYRAVYAFDLENEKLDKDPVLTINPDELQSFASNHFEDVSKKARKKIKTRIKKFAPSGIAVNSKGDYYIISARGSVIAVYNQKGNLQKVDLLDEHLLPQPEGITFDEKENLYISTEGKGLMAQICVFNHL